MGGSLMALQCLYARQTARLDLRVAGRCDLYVGIPQTATYLAHHVAFRGRAHVAETDKRHNRLVWCFVDFDGILMVAMVLGVRLQRGFPSSRCALFSDPVRRHSLISSCDRDWSR